MYKFCQHTFHKKNGHCNFILPRINSKLFLFLIIVLVGSIGVGYIGQINSVALGGYDLNTLQKKINKLQTENEQLSLQIMELQSPERIKTSTQNLQMVATDKVEYIVSPSAAVAVR